MESRGLGINYYNPGNTFDDMILNRPSRGGIKPPSAESAEGPRRGKGIPRIGAADRALSLWDDKNRKLIHSNTAWSSCTDDIKIGLIGSTTDIDSGMEDSYGEVNLDKVLSPNR